MSDGTHISWTNATWPIVAGCEKVSRGCKHCWAIRDSWRLAHNPAVADVYQGTVHKVGSQLAWTGLIRELPERLGWPVHWRKPRRIFVCSQSDLFHEKVSDRFIDQAFAVMAMCPRHTFQLLTKRPDRLFAYLSSQHRAHQISCAGWDLAAGYPDMRGEDYGGWPKSIGFPLANVHLGFSAENQETFDERWPHMEQLARSGWLVWLSAEPLVGPIDLSRALVNVTVHKYTKRCLLRWVVSGGESGPGADPTHPDWLRQHRDQCAAAGVPWHLKQNGVWVRCETDVLSEPPGRVVYPHDEAVVLTEGRPYSVIDAHGVEFVKVGKKLAGRRLDGREHLEFPA